MKTNHGNLKKDFISTINVAQGSYQIYLPNKDTDYIQGKIAKRLEPYELPMLQDIRSRVKPKDYVFDVGANIGNHTLYLAAIAKCNLFSFEPNKALCDALNQSVELNGLNKQVLVHQVGVGAKSGVGKFDHLDNANLGAQSITTNLGNASEAEFEIIALDNLERNFQVRVLKIDVEGMEIAVLKGAKEMIATDMPLLYIECQLEAHFAEIHKWVTQHGYVFWDTFNATPTHLFIHESQVSLSQQIERVLYKSVREEYRSLNDISRLQENLDSVREKLKAAHAKNQDLTNSIQEILSSLTFQVGLNIRNSLSFLGMLKLPIALWRIYRLARLRDNQQKKQDSPTTEKLKNQITTNQ
jgi:FkbM family methyltransferase